LGSGLRWEVLPSTARFPDPGIYYHRDWGWLRHRTTAGK